MGDDCFNPRAFMDDEPVEFTKAMEGIDTIPGPKTDEPTIPASTPAEPGFVRQ